MKKLLFAAVAAAGVFAYKRWQDSENEKAVWSEATDEVG
ncbi:DLW-39 family protein [Arthrobacter sp. Br18]|nr:DLW-39 family protein [Arthrobacter sp. Br18]